MDTFSEDFKTWMDDKGFNAQSLAPIIGKSAGTLAQWRSRGVPERESVRNFLTAFMRDYQSPQPASQDNQILIPFTDHQYDLVKKAGELTQLGTKEFVRMAATERALERIAEEEKERIESFPPLNKVAKDETPYRTGNGNGGK